MLGPDMTHGLFTISEARGEAQPCGRSGYFRDNSIAPGLPAGDHPSSLSCPARCNSSDRSSVARELRNYLTPLFSR